MALPTGSAYPPFTDKEWLGGGMITELVNAIREDTPNPLPHKIEWEDDWSQHLFPKLDRIQEDMGFSWLRPNCEADPTNERCAHFHFSDPLFVMPIQLFVRAESGFTFDDESDIEGKTLCRPKGYYTHYLDADGRNWLKDCKITLVRLDSPDDCFRALVAGEVDAVPESPFLGGDRVVGPRPARSGDPAGAAALNRDSACDHLEKTLARHDVFLPHQRRACRDRGKWPLYRDRQPPPRALYGEAQPDLKHRMRLNVARRSDKAPDP
jgi:hypothetical protein